MNLKTQSRFQNNEKRKSQQSLKWAWNENPPLGSPPLTYLEQKLGILHTSKISQKH